MFRKTLIAPLLAATAMALTVTPAYAGKADRARQAIAAAEAKVHTAETMGAGSELPREAATARATLSRAKESLERGDKSDSIDQAIQASAMADTAIGVLQRDKDRQVAAAQATSQAQTADAAMAQQQAAAAQNQAADANARAAMAERSAAASAAEAQAARVAAAQPAQVETTVTTQQPAAAAPRRAARTVTRKTTTTARRAAPAAPATTTTTTTVKQAVN
jgi:hypothetical protein